MSVYIPNIRPLIYLLSFLFLLVNFVLLDVDTRWFTEITVENKRIYCLQYYFFLTTLYIYLVILLDYNESVRHSQ